MHNFIFCTHINTILMVYRVVSMMYVYPWEFWTVQISTLWIHTYITTIINPIFPLEIARNQCHIKTLNHIKAHLRSLYMSRIGLGLITRPYRDIFVTFRFWVWGSVPPESFFSSSLILICVMGVCVGSCVSLKGVTGLTGLNKSLVTESLIRSLTSKW